MEMLLSGNEAFARGVFEHGGEFASAYPGTPSTEILETIARHFKADIYCEWSINEKVALEVAVGASWGGARSIAAMKHVGVNVAADPLMTLSYTGVGAGLILVSADDPSLHSSQNEQDNRCYGKFASIPVLEPADSQDSLDMVKDAFEISEKFDTPVLFRMTTRISHSKGLVKIGERRTVEHPGFEKNIAKYVMVPSNAMVRHKIVIDRLEALKKLAETTPLNKVEWGDKKVGIISGQRRLPVRERGHARSELPQARSRISAADEQDHGLRLEGGPHHRRRGARALLRGADPRGGHPLRGEEVLLELTWSSTSSACARDSSRRGCSRRARPSRSSTQESVLPRPPVLCPGCPHRGVMMALRKCGVYVTGDIGCYTLAALPPLETIDTCLCMGASVNHAFGIEKAKKTKKKAVAVIGDSTFLHSGITGLANVVYNRGTQTTIIVDNRITAMTGGQDHPGTSKTLMGEATHAIDLVQLVQGARRRARAHDRSVQPEGDARRSQGRDRARGAVRGHHDEAVRALPEQAQSRRRSSTSFSRSAPRAAPASGSAARRSRRRARRTRRAGRNRRSTSSSARAARSARRSAPKRPSRN